MSRACPPGTFPYTIQPGDTFYNLARRFNITLAAVISANPMLDPNNLPVGQTVCIPRMAPFPPCPERNFYTISPGDTFYAIARRFSVSLDDLLEANPLADPDRLQVGQVICIPLAVPPVRCTVGTFTYTIQAGDTYYSLARRFNTSVTSLIGANPGVNPEALLVGQQICIPREA